MKGLGTLLIFMMAGVHATSTTVPSSFTELLQQARTPSIVNIGGVSARNATGKVLTVAVDKLIGQLGFANPSQAGGGGNLADGGGLSPF